MPHKPRKQGARTWRDARARAVKAGRLHEEAVGAHKRRLLAVMHAYARGERRRDDEGGDA